MLKLMIAEDEAIERKALNFLIERFYKNQIGVVCEAGNGKDAVEKALEYKPDIILMDIHMPIMDGLKASESIKKQLPNSEFIILTAYSSFEYAKEAIHIGINDYLLKPVSNEEFCKSIDKIIQKINVRKKEAIKQEKMKKQIVEMIPFVEKEIIMEMIYGGQISESKFYDYKKILGITNSEFMCAVFRAEYEEGFREEMLTAIKNKFRFMISQVAGHIFLKDMVFLLLDDDLSVKKKGQLVHLIDEIHLYLKETYKVGVYVGLSEIHDDIPKLHLSYQQAITEVKNKDKKKEMHNQKVVYPYEKESIICGKIINEDFHGAVNVFEEIINYFINNQDQYDQNGVKKQLKQFFFMINRNIIQFFGNTFERFTVEKEEEEIEKLKDINDIRDYMKNLFKEMIGMISNYKKDRSVKIIEGVKSYIDENYMKDISLNEVADYTELSSHYLCKLFKKVEKVNFKDYLIKVRMEKAKEMLREGNKSIKEIAMDIGYTDPNYFSRAFKKYAGKSATDYAKL